MATLSTYTALVQNEVDDTSQRATNIIERAVKDTYQEILRYTVEFLAGTTEEDITATVSQRYVTPTSTFQDLKRVLWKNTSNTSYRVLERITEEDYYEKYVNRDDGDPTGYYVNAGNIYFDIAPSTAGTVKVSGVEVQPELEGLTVSILPNRFIRVLLNGAIAKYKAYEGLPDANEYMNMYHGPYFEQGKIGGDLKGMIQELQTRHPAKKLKLFGR